MGYGYEYYYDAPMMDDPAFEMVTRFYMGVMAFLILLGIVCYVLRALGLYTIAGRRGLSRQWLAWIPVADQWLLGEISDQYQYLVKGQTRSRRKLLLGLSIALTSGVLLMYAVLLVLTVQLALMGQAGDGVTASMVMGPFMFLMLVCVLIMVLAIVQLVLRNMCVYDVYRSCDPDNAVPFLVLGILLGFLEPIFLMVVRRRDLGMPPRKAPAQPIPEE